MHVWSGVVLAGSALLVFTGPPKLLRPAATITALRSVGAVWVGRRTVRALATAEIVAGTAAIVAGGRWADAAVAAFYLGFSGFLLRALRTPMASCGCTSADDAPPTIGHLVMTAAFATGAVAAVIAGGRSGVIALAADTGVGTAVTMLAFAAVASWLAWSILTVSSPARVSRRTPPLRV